MKSLSAALIFRFVDRLSQPARAAARAIGSIEDAQRLANRASSQWSRGLDDLDGKLSRLANVSLVTEGLERAGRAMATPLIAGTRAAIGYSESVAKIADTADMTRVQVRRMNDDINRASRLGRGPSDVARAADIYVSGGLAPDVAGALLPVTTKLVIGQKVAFEDAANAAMAFNQSLGVAANEMQSAFDKAVTSAKAGRFEFAAMAQYLPIIGSAGARLGLRGEAGVSELTAAATTIMDKTQDEARTADQLKDLLLKATAEQTARAYREFGVDIVAALDRAKAENRSPIDAILDATAIAQSRGARFNQLFTDQEAQLGLAALVEGRQRFSDLRDEANRAGSVVETSFRRMGATDAEKLRSYTASMERLGIAAGVILAPAVGWAATAAQRLTGWLSRATASGNPLAKAAVWAAAGLAGLAVAAGVVGNAVMGILAPWFIMKSLFGTMGGAAIAGVFANIARGIAVARTAMIGLNFAMLANPAVWIAAAVVAAIALVAGAAYLIYRNWGVIGPWLAGVWDRVKGVISTAASAVTGFLMRWTIVGPIARNWTAAVDFIRAILRLAGEVVGLGLDYIKLGIMRFTPAGFILRNWGPITRIVGAVWRGASELVDQGLAAAGSAILRFTPLGFIIRNWTPITTFVSRLWDTTRTIVSTGLSAIGTAITSWSPLQAFISAFAPTFAWFQELPARFMSVGTNIVNGMTAGIRGQRAQVQAAARTAAGGTATAAANALGIRSPSRVFARLGDYTMQGLAIGVRRSQALPIGRVAAVAAALSGVVPQAGVALAASGSPASPSSMSASPAPTINQTFNLYGLGQQDPRAIARELFRLQKAGERAAYNDGAER